MIAGSVIQLELKENGLPSGVIVDGHRLPNVLLSTFRIEPGTITKLIVEIHVSTVETIRPEKKL